MRTINMHVASLEVKVMKKENEEQALTTNYSIGSEKSLQVKVR